MKICISISERPGTFGSHFHNQGYQLLGLDYMYLPLAVLPKSLEGILQVVRDNFHGCSVSKPHKIEAINYLDELDESVSLVGAVNTILNIGEKRLRGYNTDIYGAQTAIEMTLGNIKEREVLLVGAGGVARAIGNAVINLGGKLFITNRTEERARELAKKMEANYLPWEERGDNKYHLLINATCVGMGNTETIIPKEAIANFEVVMDVVVSSQTRLLEIARASGKIVIPGTLMSTYQAARQFEIYTGQRAPQKLIENTLNELVKK